MVERLERVQRSCLPLVRRYGEFRQRRLGATEAFRHVDVGNRHQPLDGDDGSFVERLRTILRKNPSMSVLPGIVRASADAITWRLAAPVVQKE